MVLDDLDGAAVAGVDELCEACVFGLEWEEKGWGSEKVEGRREGGREEKGRRVRERGRKGGGREGEREVSKGEREGRRVRGEEGGKKN